MGGRGGCPQCLKDRRGGGADGWDTSATAASDAPEEGGVSSGSAVSSEAAAAQRRLRQVRAKIDRSTDGYNILKGFLTLEGARAPPRGTASPSPQRPQDVNAATAVGSQSPPTGASKASAELRLVLSPPPRPAVAVGNTAVATTGGNAAGEAEAILQTLSDADILELFGGA